MKSILVKLFAILVLFYSCSSDDEGNSNELEGEAFIGTWQLTAINVSSAVDGDNDGDTSTNLLDEVDCLQETITINETLTWSSNAVNILTVTSITGDFYNVACTDPISINGNWGIENGILYLVSNNTRQFSLNGEILRETIGDDLPGIQSLEYQKQ